MNLQKELPELVKAGAISQETAEAIAAYYKNKAAATGNRLFAVFGVLGAILTGLGIILIIAHNWDELPRGMKACFAFLPLLLGQLLCGYVLLRKRHSLAWRESATAFLFFAVGACMALVSQIFNIPGDFGSFLLTWTLLCLPLLYVMQSSMASLLYLSAITVFAVNAGYWSYPAGEPGLYWLLLLGLLPHYYNLYKQRPGSNAMVFHNWGLPLSLIIVLGTVATTAEELMYVAYMSLFGLFYLLGTTAFFDRQPALNNGYKLLGSLGTLILLLTLSFGWFWEGLVITEWQTDELLRAPELYASLLLTLLATVLLFLRQRNKPLGTLGPMALMFLLFLFAFVIGLDSPFAVVLINLYVLAAGIMTIREGAKRDHLGILNYGLAIITVLVICRFFDTDLSFVIRGLLFMLVGAGFFIANYTMLKKRKAHEH